ncbi:hypothetical protein COU20_00980 [Candidatus Kaiserbacteria bacterium CG10_big_fil_rev_8_21_14_0_10_59_10]|uniref:Glycosyltransferase subfamily 4-like N-terminal domain-containing protein n=1 Tax=Candidatus Kaiserbacteria bacterium CG10_big_fil_rev_8_21_14_0_10_59_10 TaxID=1974612 RepID=A0A2H0UAL2_9BACT|nr:MAG: hypothetical protein COU20_00980 [Candidatus Kaiserbacteria bacterium CG10_big_fil_rev_8_21_14_0_10_59_10]
MSKKILFVITKPNWGGAQRYVFDIATRLPPNLTPLVALGDGKGALAERLAAAGIRTVCIPHLTRDISPLRELQAFASLYALLRRERPDVVHLNSSKAGGLGALAARLARAPRIVFTVHGWPFKEARSPISRALIYAVSWCTAALSHCAITVSREDERIASRMPLIARKTAYVPLGIAEPEHCTRKEAEKRLSARIRLEPSPPSLRIVSIAELTPNKGISYGIAAAALLRERGVPFQYVVFGEGEERHALAAQAEKSGVSAQVQLAGFVPDAARYLPAFDVLLLPSVKEGTPYVLLEAAAAGIPIIATTVVDSSFADIGVRLVPARDERALTDALAEMHHAPRGAPHSFPIERMVEETLRAYHMPAMSSV